MRRDLLAPQAAGWCKLWRMDACQHCGAPLRPEQAFCPNCTEPVNPPKRPSTDWDAAATIPEHPTPDRQSADETEHEGVLDIYWEKRPERE